MYVFRFLRSLAKTVVKSAKGKLKAQRRHDVDVSMQVRAGAVVTTLSFHKQLCILVAWLIGVYVIAICCATSYAIDPEQPR